MSAFLVGFPQAEVFPGEAENEDIATVYNLNGRDVKVVISALLEPTDLGGQLKKASAFCIIRLKYDGNFFNINLPMESFKKLTKAQREKLVEYLVSIYDEAFSKFFEIFRYIPRGYRFNITFGKTELGTPFNKINITDKISNIFANILPYKYPQYVLSDSERAILLHEIGHGLFSIAVGNLRYARTRAIEEGFVDYLAGRGSGKRGQVAIFSISKDQAERMKGLTQLDIDKSIWGEEAALKPTKSRRYDGVTHHVFGIEFIETFIDVFGKEKLSEFLIRLRAAEDMPPEGDFGTEQVKDIFAKMRFKREKVEEFENELHKRLKNNVFKIVE